jgi:CO/xanthine dehydrogenase Mo-binding subunit/aerobic-type carbon monoxide dehydrogenase small subunit (CoxS/CutS family)
VRQDFALKVNERVYRVCVEPDTPLVYVLRNDLHLMSVKLACGLEQCGACKVIVDGQAMPSCRLAVRSAQGREITTLEGLGSAGALHPLQQAFIDEGATQCGFCTPGIIVAAKALLDRRPRPCADEVRAELASNICRCGVHERVLRAIQRASGRALDAPSFERWTTTEQPSQPEAASRAGTVHLPSPFRTTPDLDSWIRINDDETITLFTGKVELGQGIRTAVAQIGAEELDVELSQVRVATVDTDQSPDEGYTVSSMSLETTGNAIRYAAAQARQIMLSVAYEELEAPIERLRVAGGTISDPDTGRSVTYWDLFAGRRFGRRVMPGVRHKRPGEYKLVGQPVPRLDLLAKVTGASLFVHDLVLPGMVHGRVVRPPNRSACLVSADACAVEGLPGVLRVVRDGSFLGVIAEREEEAVRAMEALRQAAEWRGEPDLPPAAKLMDILLHQPDEPMLVLDGSPVPDPIPPIEAPGDAERTLSATYFRPYQMHGALAPSAAVARMSGDKMTVWTHAQGVFPQREALARALGLSEDDVRVIHMEGPGCFGHTGADDAALDAALLARAVPGKPVSLKWMRAQEHTWEPYGPATVVQMQASLGAGGEVVDWNHDVWSYSQVGRASGDPETSGLLAAWHMEEPAMPPRSQARTGPHQGIYRNADPLYAFPQRRIVKHFVPDSPLRVSALRGLSAFANVFAIESFMDELAHAAGADPVEFRLRHLAEPRARDVIKAASEKAGWRLNSASQQHRGLGIAFAQYKNRQCYVAVVVQVSVDRASGLVRLERATIAADAGQIVNPDGLSSQFEGGFIQGASWTLREQVRFDRMGVTSTDWLSYPVMRFADTPRIETVLIDRPGQPYLGSGEAAPVPTGAAIANAIRDAVGIRLRVLPFTPARVKAALAGRNHS